MKMTIALKALIAKLNDVSKKAAMRAANICVSHGNYEVEIEHLLLAYLEDDQSDISIALKKWNINSNAVKSDLSEQIVSFASGSARTPVFSSSLVKLLEHAWLISSI